MRLFAFVALTVVAFSKMVWASGPVVITITTTDEGVSYAMRDPNWRKEQTFKKVEELEAEMRKNYAPENADDGGGVWLRPDDRTAYNTVFDVLQRMKGLKIQLMLLEGKVGNDRVVASWPLQGFLVKKLEKDPAQK